MRGLGKRESSKERRHPLHRGILIWDKKTMRNWQRLRLHPGIKRTLLLLVRLGDGWGWIFLALLFMLLLPGARFFDLLSQGLIAAAVTLPFYWGLKSFFRRTRPHNMFKRIVPQISPRDLYSFPSGHTM